MSGVVETKELLVGVNELAVELIKHFKDGVQLTDAIAILEAMKSNEDLKAKIEAAYKNIQAVSEEIKDLTLPEGIELIMVQASYVPKLIEAAKK